jgi:hypothetical protein
VLMGVAASGWAKPILARVLKGSSSDGRKVIPGVLILDIVS